MPAGATEQVHIKLQNALARFVIPQEFLIGDCANHDLCPFVRTFVSYFWKHAIVADDMGYTDIVHFKYRDTSVARVLWLDWSPLC